MSILFGVFVYVLGGSKEYRYVFRVPHGQYSIKVYFSIFQSRLMIFVYTVEYCRILDG